MLKQMIIALSLVGATVAVNAQTGKAVQNADGTWVLDNVKLSTEDAASLKTLLSSDKGASLSAVEGTGKVSTYGAAKLGNLKATRVVHGSKLGNAASDNIIIVNTTTTTKHQLGLDKSRVLQMNALLQKYK